MANAAWMLYNLATGLHIIALGRLATVLLNADAYRRNRSASEKGEVDGRNGTGEAPETDTAVDGT